ncbi:unnamed protein product [Dibothriocephalus latus]|uniref:Uncharacterized protein n=1 Tax=Dibothriocephalus latus TaxID=60516 RepID=A0A3P7KVN6_DIBLA|nr:unnamed protein product [Dibothriocephalus latus]
MVNNGGRTIVILTVKQNKAINCSPEDSITNFQFQDCRLWAAVSGQDEAFLFDDSSQFCPRDDVSIGNVLGPILRLLLPFILILFMVLHLLFSLYAVRLLLPPCLVPILITIVLLLLILIISPFLGFF